MRLVNADRDTARGATWPGRASNLTPIASRIGDPLWSMEKGCSGKTRVLLRDGSSVPAASHHRAWVHGPRGSRRRRIPPVRPADPAAAARPRSDRQHSVIRFRPMRAAWTLFRPVRCGPAGISRPGRAHARSPGADTTVFQVCRLGGDPTAIPRRQRALARPLPHGARLPSACCAAIGGLV